MNPKIKVVFDSNIYISAAINPAGPSEAWLRIAGRRLSSFQLFASEAIFKEVANKLVTKFKMSEIVVEQYINGLREVVQVVKPTKKLNVVKADPDDNILFECAVEAKAQLLVSADKQVLKIGSYKGIGVCHPSDLRNIFAQDLNHL